MGPVVEASGSSVCTRTKLAWALITCALRGACSAGRPKPHGGAQDSRAPGYWLCQAP